MEITVKYKWKDGSRVRLDAQQVGRRFEMIERRDKKLTPEAVVDDARPPFSPLHSAFEWDDEVAAEKYRVGQARHLIRNMVVIRVGSEEPSGPVRAFVNVQPSAEHRYESVFTVLSDSEKRERLVAKARQELTQWRRRYAALTELAEVFDMIDELSLEPEEVFAEG